MRSRRSPVTLAPAIVATVAILMAGVTACSPSPATLPIGVSVDLYQTRLDVAERTIEISVANDSPVDVTILGASLSSDQFVTPTSWTARAGGTLVRAGFAVDLPVALPAAACDAPAPIHRVTLEFITSNGDRGATEVDVDERYDQLVQLRQQECLAQSVADVAAMSMTTPPTVETLAGVDVIVVPLSVAPAGGDGSIVLRSIESTVLLALADPGTGAAVETLALDRTITGTAAPSTIEIVVRPGRCDPHAVAEDKQGTIFTLDVVAPDGVEGVIMVRADDAVKVGIYDAIAEICDFPAA